MGCAPWRGGGFPPFQCISGGGHRTGPGSKGPAAKCVWGEGPLPSHGLHPPSFQTPPPQRGVMRWDGGQKNFKEKCILMAKSKGKFLLLMKIPIPGVAGWMLFILGSSSADASNPMRFFVIFGPPLCVCGGGGVIMVHSFWCH